MIWGLGGAGAVYGLVTLTVFLGQRALQYAPSTELSAPAPSGVSEIELTTQDGLKILAWADEAPSERGALLLHGNGGTRADVMDVFRGFKALGYRPLVVDYRGYGASEGSPTETGLYLDAQAGWDWLERNGAREILIWGYSLGSGVAVETASKNPASALVLDAPFDSAAHLAQLRYPWLPASWLLLDRYDSMRKIQDIDCPLLVVHGDMDRVIPMFLGKRLFDHALEPKRWLMVPGAGHGGLRRDAQQQYWGLVRSLTGRGSGGGANDDPPRTESEHDSNQ
ncbi:MAG: alpha/beta hydrolase [Myxococcota bacterium]